MWYLRDLGGRGSIGKMKLSFFKLFQEKRVINVIRSYEIRSEHKPVEQ